jgi:hypothetical protein
MFTMNRLSLGKNDPRLRCVKDCINQVSPAAKRVRRALEAA